MYPTNVSLGCIAPYNFTAKSLTTEDIPHDYASGRTAYDNGSMDGFYEAEYKTNETFGHYNGSTIPIYWDMAEEYATSDNMFSANLSYSLPNHWFLISGAAPNVTEQNFIDTPSLRSTYLYQAERTPTIQDLLNNSSVSWKYYDFPLTPYPNAIVSGGSAYDYWNPMAGRAESYTANYDSHFVARDDFLGDVANDTLPQISWVIPDAEASDHPGYNITDGESWVAQLVDAVAASPEWNSTVIFVIWDDYGGWYDNVAPPHLDGNLLSFRSPILVISPYSKENYISHVQLNFFSLLHYVEWQFGLGCLTGLDCTAQAPFDFFNFNQTARAPIIFPTNWLNASYPMPLQAGGRGIPVCAGCETLIPGLWNGPDLQVTNPALGD
jgi:phospholipase C